MANNFEKTPAQHVVPLHSCSGPRELVVVVVSQIGLVLITIDLVTTHTANETRRATTTTRHLTRHTAMH